MIVIEVTNSSAINRVGYESEDETMFVQFRSGDTVYQYDDIDADSFQSFITAPSIGRAFHMMEKTTSSEKHDSRVLEDDNDFLCNSDEIIDIKSELAELLS